MVASARLTLTGFLARFTLALLVIVASGPDAYLKIRSYVTSLSPTTSFKIKLLRAGEVLETVSFPGE